MRFDVDECGDDENDPPENPLRTAILILGMHRSGTSALTRTVSLLGADLPRNLMPALDGNNAAGFWESLDVYHLNDDLLASMGSAWDDWRRLDSRRLDEADKQSYRARAAEILREEFHASSCFVLKDPRICRLLPFWTEVLATFGAAPVCLLPFRNPLEVARSLRARDGFDACKSQLLWLRHVLDAEQASRGLPRSVVSFQGLLHAPLATVARISAALGMSWPRSPESAASDIAEFLQQRHRHHAVPEPGLPVSPEITEWVKAAYSALVALESAPYAVAPLRRLDELRAEVARADDTFGVLIDAERAAQAESSAVSAALAARWAGAASDLGAQVKALEQSVMERETRSIALQRDVADREATIATLSASLERAQDQHGGLVDLKNRLLYRLHAINLSPAWQLGRPLRALEYRWPVLTQRAAAAAKLLWWGASLQLPDRLRLRRLANHLLESGDFALTWYVERYPDVVLSGFNPALHWLVSGWREGRDPNPLFDSNWYLDEHPELRDSATNPFLHYLSEGAAAGWDPNPLFDTEAYVGASDGACDPVSALRHFAKSSQPFAQGAYRSADALADLQQAYRAETQTCLLRDERSHQKRYAVFLQCGVGSAHRAWLSANDKDWDLIVNHYDDTQRGAVACQVEFEQRGRRPGTKFTAIDAVLRGWPQLLARYDYLLLLDDDIELSEVDISRLFSTAAEQGLDLVQASLSRDSHGCHPVFQTTGRPGFRDVNGVEIMMPVLSRRALALAQPLFGQTISGWGLDVALAALVRARLGGRAAVVDEIVAKHCKPIDLSNGSYYRMLRQASIFPLLEYRYLRRAYAADAGFFEI